MNKSAKLIKESVLRIKTPEGLGEGMPLTDIQQNTKAIRMLAGAILSWFLLAVWLIWYIINNNVINNIVANCIC